MNRIEHHFPPPSQDGPEPTVRVLGPVEVQAGLGCKCGCKAAAISIRMGPAVVLMGSRASADAVADAIRDAAAETWPGGE